MTAQIPRILSEIMSTAFETAGDIRIIGTATSQPQLLELARELRPDIVIMGLDEATVPEFRWDLYLADPLLRILGIGRDGRQTFVYELRPHQESQGELSPLALVAAIRRLGAARASAGSGRIA